jgi:hypothetical protein
MDNIDVVNLLKMAAKLKDAGDELEGMIPDESKKVEKPEDQRVITLGKMLQKAGYEVLSFKYARENIELTILPLKPGEKPKEWLWVPIPKWMV